MTKLILRWVSLAVAFWVAAYFMSAHVVITGDWLTYAGIAFIFGLVNATIGTLTRIFTFPITFLSMGLWLVLINACMLLITDQLSDSFSVSNFGWAILASIVISVVSTVVNGAFNALRK